jgi:hypothetical protein
MKNQLSDNLPKTLKTGCAPWLQISPDLGEGYRIFDPVAEIKMAESCLIIRTIGLR